MKPARKQLLVVLLAVTVVPAAVAGWLGWRLLVQDRIIAVERLREVREHRADEVVQTLSRSLAALIDSVHNLPSGSVKSLDVPLAYAPEPRPLPEAPAAIFAVAEQAEFRRGSEPDAVALYRRLTSSTDAAIRAGAWLRLARTLFKLAQREQAIDAYRQLGRIENAAAGGAPAPLAAQWAICTVAEQTGRMVDLRREGERLRLLLDSGRFSLSRDIYEAYADDAERWSKKPRPVMSEALADAASSKPAENGCGVFRGLWITWLAADRRTVLLSPDYTARLLPGGPVRVRFAAQAEKHETLRRAEDTGLPWSVAISLTDPAKEQEAFTTRRRLLVSLLALVVAVGIGGGYLGWRLIRRELALAQMQADIVAAVSHEFRTPLTSMRQVSAALSEGRVPDEDRKQAYYEALARATERLHRLVESLLDFGKMESDAMPYHMEPLDLAALTVGIAGEFEREAAEKGFAIHVDSPSVEVPVKADAEALGRSLWNLLDNAVKYSGESREVWVNLSRNGTKAALRVVDKGLGIPRNEQSEVFRKFFRVPHRASIGFAAQESGLAMVDHIVRAHHGNLSLESEPGAGSTFAIHLPIEEE